VATEFTDALVLRTVDYGDTDRIVTLLTRSHGKVSGLARGARRSQRRFGGSLEPGALVEVELAPTRGELFRLAQARIRQAFPGLLSDFRKLTWAGAALELVREAVPPREPDPLVLEATLRLFELLEADGPPRRDRLLAFEARTVGLLGWAPNLRSCGSCGRRAAEGQAACFDAALGGLVCRACGGAPLVLSGAARARLERALGERWDDSEPWAAEEMRQIERALGPWIRRQIGRPLAVTEWGALSEPGSDPGGDHGGERGR
jgi:DNA repair protein RecO (recombination protein O)